MANSAPFIRLTDTSVAKPSGSPSCPKCQSIKTVSAAKRPTADSYWRCLGCGEVWNPSLLPGGPPKWWQR